MGLTDGSLCDTGDFVGYHCVAGLCLRGQCGDGVADSMEECDDGNQAEGDGCSATCQLEP